MDFAFERRRLGKLTPEHILPKLISAAEHFGFREFSMRELQSANLGVTRAGVESAFGSWSDGMKALRAELQKQGMSLRPRNTKRLSDDQLFTEMARIWTLVGHRPSRYEWEGSSPAYWYKTYKKRFGGWTNACLKFLEWQMGAPVELSNGDPRVRPDVAGHSASTHTSCATETIDPVRRRAPTARLRLQVLDRDSFRCVLCGRSPALERGAILHIDHVIPFSRGGPATLDNLRTLCQRCNLGRGNAMSLGHPLAQDKS